jgi:hypothetical protein
MRHVTWLGLLVGATAIGGTAYKSVGPDGTVIFSDRPMPNAEEVRLPQPSTYAPAALPAGSSVPASAPAPVSGGEYSGFAITVPKNEETLHNRDRSVDVDLSLDPGLLEGHSFTLLLDGAELAKGLRTNRMRLTDVERGPHQLEATIYDASGQEVLRSQPIRFYLVTETLIKEPLDAQKRELNKGMTKDEMTLERRVWDKWARDLERYQYRSDSDPLPEAAPPVPPIGPPPEKGAENYKEALKAYDKASATYKDTHRAYQQPKVDPKEPYKPDYKAPPVPTELYQDGAATSKTYKAVPPPPKMYGPAPAP